MSNVYSRGSVWNTVVYIIGGLRVWTPLAQRRRENPLCATDLLWQQKDTGIHLFVLSLCTILLPELAFEQLREVHAEVKRRVQLGEKVRNDAHLVYTFHLRYIQRSTGLYAREDIPPCPTHPLHAIFAR